MIPAFICSNVFASIGLTSLTAGQLITKIDLNHNVFNLYSAQRTRQHLSGENNTEISRMT